MSIVNLCVNIANNYGLLLFTSCMLSHKIIQVCTIPVHELYGSMNSQMPGSFT